MEHSSAKGIVVKLGIAIIVIVLIDLFYLNYWILKRGNSQTNIVPQIQEESREINRPSPTSLPVQNESNEKIVETKTVVEKEIQTVVQTSQKEIFIPIGSGTLKSNTWDDISGLEVTIDTNKYSAIESVIFEATLYPEGGNGRAYARLKNITDINPFVESEISGTGAIGEFKSSGKIPIPSGSKRYGVQAKSDIENFPAHVENARIKISLK